MNTDVNVRRAIWDEWQQGLACFPPEYRDPTRRRDVFALRAKRGMPTLTEIAQRHGVSPSYASRVLTNGPDLLPRGPKPRAVVWRFHVLPGPAPEQRRRIVRAPIFTRRMAILSKLRSGTSLKVILGTLGIDRATYLRDLAQIANRPATYGLRDDEPIETWRKLRQSRGA